MLKVTMIGTLGADAEKKSADNGKFTTFRAAHNDVWTDAAGAEHTQTIWVDCILNDHPKVADFLKQGTQVYVEGYPRLRVYSSPKDRCMKAGMTISVQKLELLGGKTDLVPRQLFDANGQLFDVTKYFFVNGVKNAVLLDKRGNIYNVDKKGWATPQTTAQDDAVVDNGAETQQTKADDYDGY